MRMNCNFIFSCLYYAIIRMLFLFQCSSPAYHLFHAHLDFRMWALIILHQLNEIRVTQSFIELAYTTDDSGLKSPMNICIDFIIWDVIYLTQRQVGKVSKYSSLLWNH